jgi:hypothetical protein
VDSFETALGYRSLLGSADRALLPSRWPPEPAALEGKSEEQLVRIARAAFDSDLAERLRCGEWHWKCEVGEIAEQVAEALSRGDAPRYARLRSALREHYEDQYRRPTEQEWSSYLRKRHQRVPGSGATPPHHGESDWARVSLYYLDDRITDRDPHDQGCPCTLCDKRTYKALGVGFYRLDLAGLQAYRDLRMGADDDSFGDWCNEQESQATVYGPDETAAVANALAYAATEGWLVVNDAKRHPSLASLAQVLGILVGADGYLTGRGLRGCELAQLPGEALCPVCFASLVFDVLSQG